MKVPRRLNLLTLKNSLSNVMMTATKIDEKISKTRKLLCLLFKTVLSDFKTIGILITLKSKNSLKNRSTVAQMAAR